MRFSVLNGIPVNFLFQRYCGSFDAFAILESKPNKESVIIVPKTNVPSVSNLERSLNELLGCPLPKKQTFQETVPGHGFLSQ